MTISLTATELLSLDLTKDYLTSNGYSPLYVGNDWSLSFSVIDDSGDPVDLTDALIVMSILRYATRVTRRSDTEIEDGTTNQIVIHPDQTGDGAGLFVVKWSHHDDDVTALASLLGAESSRGIATYDIVISFDNADTDARLDSTFAEGRIEVIQGATPRPLELPE